MNQFTKALESASNEKLTENGALTYCSSLSTVLDLFAQGGAFRTRTSEDISKQVLKAFLEAPILTLRCLFYLRDVRGGQGERRTFRIAINTLAQEAPDLVKRSLHLIPEFGRFDDLLSLLDTSLKGDVINLIKATLENDFKDDNAPSLLGKWLPSENTSSSSTKTSAKAVRKELALSSKDYRKMLSELRKRINIVERQMCSKEFQSIDFSKVPSIAAMKYRKAFRKQDGERYQAYLESVKKGEAKINASTLYPYDIVKEIGFNPAPGSNDDTLELQWKALPDYMKDAKATALVVADVSGSMTGLPMYVSISLAIYTAERAKGPFKDMFLTFSSSSKIEKIKGNTLREKILNLSQAHWEGSTNLQSAFDEILRVAVENNVPAEDLPQTLFIVSDMEFNCCNMGRVEGRYDYKSVTNFDLAKAKFESAGYTLPSIVFWNCASRNSQVPVERHQSGAFLVSGCSPSILKYALNKTFANSEELMMEVLNSERYAQIK